MKAIVKLCLLLILPTVVTDIYGQRPQILKDRFQPVNTTKLTFTPYKLSDFSKVDKTKTEKDPVTLPNGKKVTLAAYLKTINTIESNLSEIGISRDRTQEIVIASNYKPRVTGIQTTIKPLSVNQPVTTLSKSTLSSRFQFNNLLLSDKATQFLSLKNELSNILVPNADNLPDEAFTNNKDFLDIPQLKALDHTVKVKVNQKQNGLLDPFSISGNRLHADSLNRLIKNTRNKFTIGLNVEIAADLPGVGLFNVYKLESEFTSNANSTQKHRSKAKVQILETVMLNENKEPTGDNYTFNQNAVFNLNKKLAGADIFAYGINAVLPVDFYLNSTGVGAEFKIDIKRTGVGGTISPVVTQSVFMETSVTELVGPVADLLNFDVLDLGVGGELRLVQLGLDFGINSGLGIRSGSLNFINDTYNAINLKALKGRLFTFYVYPKFKCNNIFDPKAFLSLSCWERRRVENNFFETSSFLEHQQILVDDFKGRKLNWK